MGAVPVAVDAGGSVAGVSNQSLSIVDAGFGRFAHGLLEDVDGTIIGNSTGATAGETATFVASGIVDDYDVGASYISGTASYSGTYGMTIVSDYDDSPDSSTWATRTFEGPVTARIELHTAIAAASDPNHGHSHDVDVVELFIGEAGDLIYFDEVIIYSPTPPAQPSSVMRSFNGGVVTIDESEIPLEGQVAFGGDGLVAAFQGRDADHLVAGGLGLGIDDDSSLVTE